MYSRKSTQTNAPEIYASFKTALFRLKLAQNVVPDFFGDEYYQTVSNALQRVDGMGLSDQLGGRVFNFLYRKVFAKELEPRSHKMVADVRKYMQSQLQRLFDDACQAYPVLLSVVKTSLVQQFMDFKQAKTEEAVSNVVRAELGWEFTQDRSYDATVVDVGDMVNRVRASQDTSEANKRAGLASSRFGAAAVGDVPKEFLDKMVASKGATEKGIRKTQVGVSQCAHLKSKPSAFRTLNTRAYVKYTWLCSGLRVFRSLQWTTTVNTRITHILVFHQTTPIAAQSLFEALVHNHLVATTISSAVTIVHTLYTYD